MIRTIGKWLVTVALLAHVQTAAAGESDAAKRNAGAVEIDLKLEKSITDLEAAGADVGIEREPELTLRVEYDLFTTDDPFFDLLFKVEKVRSINIVAGRRPRADELTASALRGLGACKQLQEVAIDSISIRFKDLIALDAIPNLRSLSIRCNADIDAMFELRQYLERPEAKKLESVKLGVSEITDEDCAWLAALPNLRDIFLGGSKATITDAGLLLLARKGNLRSIGTRNTAIAPNWARVLAEASELESFEIQGLDFYDDGLEALAQLSKLRRLKVERTGITAVGLRALRGLTKLEELDVSDCKLGPEAFEHLAPLTNLKHLRASGCGLEDADLKILGRLTNLEFLDLNGNDRMTHAGIVELGKLVNLKTLWLQGAQGLKNGLNDFAPLTKLERLYVRSEDVDAAGMKAVENFHHLEELGVSHCSVGGGGLAVLKNCKSLRELDLIECDLQDDDLANLVGCENLRRLRLESNDDLTDDGIAHLAGLKNLLSLHVDSKGITGESCRHLQGMTRMHHLRIRTSGYSDDAIAVFANMPAMQRLDLFGPATLNERGFAALQQLKHLRIFSITLSPESRIAPQEVVDAFPEARLTVNNRRYTPLGD